MSFKLLGFSLGAKAMLVKMGRGAKKAGTLVPHPNTEARREEAGTLEGHEKETPEAKNWT